MLTTRQSTINVTKVVPPITEAKQIEDTSRKEVQLLLENLFQREEATVKLIIDCLFDMSAVYLINQKVPTSLAKRLAKGMAKISRSGIRIIAFRYVFKKFVASGFLTNFLFNKVKNVAKINPPPQPQKQLNSQQSPSIPPVKYEEKPSIPPIPPENTVSAITPKSDHQWLATYQQFTPESQEELNHYIEKIAKVIHRETASKQTITLTEIEEIIRQQTAQSTLSILSRHQNATD
jgi:hypothetical protein